MHLEEFDRAIEEAEKALSLCPNSASTYFALGAVLYKDILRISPGTIAWPMP
jgi:Flp pilus assembly protein TadD